MCISSVDDDHATKNRVQNIQEKETYKIANIDLQQYREWGNKFTAHTSPKPGIETYGQNHFYYYKIIIAKQPFRKLKQEFNNSN